MTPPARAGHLEPSQRGPDAIGTFGGGLRQKNPGKTVRLFRILLLSTAPFLGLSCSSDDLGPDGSETISREVFIDAYVQLRVEALRAPREELPLEDRDELLASLGLEDDDLLNFIEVRGKEVQFMRRVWEEVDSILQTMREIRRTPDQRGTW